ncbi:ErfK/YbiS/YcfS/YnhG family protein, partial [Pseudomonas putida]
MRWLLALFCLGVASVSQAAFTETIVRKPLGQVTPSTQASTP